MFGRHGAAPAVAGECGAEKVSGGQAPVDVAEAIFGEGGDRPRQCFLGWRQRKEGFEGSAHL